MEPSANNLKGVHSIERSAQEDTLLVLFNCAISNLVSYCSHDIPLHASQPALQVLFRNNFALSRDIAGLFQSFQSSSSVLDPAANPALFQSTLAIIIKVNAACSPCSLIRFLTCSSKDVVDSDKKEIVRE